MRFCCFLLKAGRFKFHSWRSFLMSFLPFYFCRLGAPGHKEEQRKGCRIDKETQIECDFFFNVSFLYGPACFWDIWRKGKKKEEKRGSSMCLCCLKWMCGQKEQWVRLRSWKHCVRYISVRLSISSTIICAYHPLMDESQMNYFFIFRTLNSRRPFFFFLFCKYSGWACGLKEAVFIHGKLLQRAINSGFYFRAVRDIKAHGHVAIVVPFCWFNYIIFCIRWYLLIIWRAIWNS